MAVVPVDPRILEVRPDGSVALLGGWSPSSGHRHFPRGVSCPFTGADDVEPVVLDSVATLWGWTAVTSPPPGYSGPVPFGVGVVELVDGLRLITRLTEPDPSRLQTGMSMRLVADPVGVDDDGNEVVAWAFAPA